MKHIKNKQFDYYEDDNGLKQGEYKSYYNGKLWEHHYYQDSKKHGISKLYYYNRTLYRMCNYINGKAHGEEKIYNEDGSLDYYNYWNHGKNITELLK